MAASAVPKLYCAAAESGVSRTDSSTCRSASSSCPTCAIDLGEALVQRRVVGRVPQHRSVSDDVLAQRLVARVGGEAGAIAVAPREHLDPQIAHFVRRLLPPPDRTRRMIGISGILGRIIVGVFHHHTRAPRQPEGRRKAIDVLPVEVPVGDVDQPSNRAVWSSAKALTSRAGSGRAAGPPAPPRRPAA